MLEAQRQSQKQLQILELVEALFKPEWNRIREHHERELKVAQLRARELDGTGAVLVAEASHYVGQSKALIVARAKCMVEACTAFGEPAGEAEQAAMADFFVQVVSARKASLQGEVIFRNLLNKPPIAELTAMLAAFDPQVHPALVEGLEILARQSAEMAGKPTAPVPETKATKYVADASLLQSLADGRLSPEALPTDGGLAITQIHFDEIKAGKDAELRARLLLSRARLRCEVLPSRKPISRWEAMQVKDGSPFTSLLKELDLLNGIKESNPRDAAIAEAALAGGYTLLTADANLQKAMERHGGRAVVVTPVLR